MSRSSRNSGNKGAIKVLGGMTGTSCDALDAACIEISQNGWSPLWSASASYPTALKKRVLELQNPRSRWTLKEVLELHRDLGQWYAKSFSAFMGKSGRDFPDLISNHGQTVAHYPFETRATGTTLQLGDPACIAFETELTVVSHFRSGDMAAGGQGAPLAPLFHKILAAGLGQGTGAAIHNLGGISNLTYLGPNGTLLAFDTGPANIWIDEATREATRGKSSFDKDGKIAARGQIDLKGVGKALTHPYFKKSPPKSTGRDDFPYEFLLSKTKARGADLVATATALTVESIARSYEAFILSKRLPLDVIYLSGGGAKNVTLVGWLADRLSPITVSTLDEAGFDSQLTEATAFACFGYFSLLGQPLGGSWTGTRSWAPPGMITPGKNWSELVRKLRD